MTGAENLFMSCFFDRAAGAYVDRVLVREDHLSHQECDNERGITRLPRNRGTKAPKINQCHRVNCLDNGPVAQPWRRLLRLKSGSATEWRVAEAVAESRELLRDGDTYCGRAAATAVAKVVQQAHYRGSHLLDSIGTN